jgi:cobalt-zinc-cadmium efflux system protein
MSEATATGGPLLCLGFRGKMGGMTGRPANSDSRHLGAALALILAFMAVEVVVGLLASSLALISDAGHMLTDAAAIALALFAAGLAAQPARGNLTYGLRRVEILSAQANGITLLLLAVWFGYEAASRLLHPARVAGGLVLATALAGIVVNLGVASLLRRGQRTSLNVEGAFLHVLSDLFAFIATAVAGLVVVLTGWTRADAVATVIVAALMAWTGSGLVRSSWRVFLEAAPQGIDVRQVDSDLHRVDGVVEVHDLHVWEVTSGFPALSAHVLVAPGLDCHERRESITALLVDRYGITHSTLQVDHPESGLIPAEHLISRSAGDARARRRPC